MEVSVASFLHSSDSDNLISITIIVPCLAHCQYTAAEIICESFDIFLVVMLRDLALKFA